MFLSVTSITFITKNTIVDSITGVNFCINSVSNDTNVISVTNFIWFGSIIYVINTTHVISITCVTIIATVLRTTAINGVNSIIKVTNIISVTFVTWFFSTYRGDRDWVVSKVKKIVFRCSLFNCRWFWTGEVFKGFDHDRGGELTGEDFVYQRLVVSCVGTLGSVGKNEVVELSRTQLERGLKIRFEASGYT